jgi:hypothetical protein
VAYHCIGEGRTNRSKISNGHCENTVHRNVLEREENDSDEKEKLQPFSADHKSHVRSNSCLLNNAWFAIDDI